MKIKIEKFHILIVFFLFLSGWLIPVNLSAAFSCVVDTSCANVTVFKMSATSNAQAELAGQANYSQFICCTGITDLSNLCSGNYATVLKLSAVTNAHVQQTGSYAESACLSAPAGNTIAVAYRADACNGDEVTMASMSASSNAHVGGTTAYATKICAKITVEIISVDINTDGVISYGLMNSNESKTTLDLSDSQIAGNDGNVAEDFNIMGQDSANWELSNSNGSDAYAHMFCNDTLNACDSPPTNYYAFNEDDYTGFASSTVASGTVTFQLRITTPNPSNVYTQQTVDVTVQAVAGT